jgi:hypothetical protein
MRVSDAQIAEILDEWPAIVIRRTQDDLDSDGTYEVSLQDEGMSKTAKAASVGEAIDKLHGAL